MSKQSNKQRERKKFTLPQSQADQWFQTKPHALITPKHSTKKQCRTITKQQNMKWLSMEKEPMGELPQVDKTASLFCSAHAQTKEKEGVEGLSSLMLAGL